MNLQFDQAGCVNGRLEYTNLAITSNKILQKQNFYSAPMKFFSAPFLLYALCLTLMSVCYLAAGRGVGTVEYRRDERAARRPTNADLTKVWPGWWLVPFRHSISRDADPSEEVVFSRPSEPNKAKSRAHQEANALNDYQYSLDNLIVPLARALTIKTIYVMEGLGPFEGAAKVPVRIKTVLMAKSDELLRMVEGVASAHAQSISRARTWMKEDQTIQRRYTSDEIAHLKGMRDSMVDIRKKGIALLTEERSEAPDVNGRPYDCRQLAGYLNGESAAEYIKDDTWDNEEGHAINPGNIHAFQCVNREKLRLVGGVVGCMDAEIAKGEATATDASFYLPTFCAVHLSMLLGSKLDSSIVAHYSFSYDEDPLTEHQRNMG